VSYRYPVPSITNSEALFVHRRGVGLEGIALRLRAALDARRQRYVILHLPRTELDKLIWVFPGLAAPAVMPLAARDDLVAVHLVVEASSFWAHLGELRAVGASGSVSVTPDVLLR
jgi:ATP phosphoribosyltransferase